MPAIPTKSTFVMPEFCHRRLLSQSVGLRHGVFGRKAPGMYSALSPSGCCREVVPSLRNTRSLGASARSSQFTRGINLGGTAARISFHNSRPGAKSCEDALRPVRLVFHSL